MVDFNRRFSPGDRVRYETVCEDGFPLVRYGFVGGQTHGDGPVVVMLDGELGGDVVDLDAIQPVDISNVTLKLDGADLLAEPRLRHGLVELWHAEAEDAGLQISAIDPIHDEARWSESDQGCALAELMSAGERYLLGASACVNEDAILVAAFKPTHWPR